MQLKCTFKRIRSHGYYWICWLILTKCYIPLWKCKLILLLGEGDMGALVDLYIFFRSLGTSTSTTYDKRNGKLTETSSFYLLAITVVKYWRHEPNINQFHSNEHAFTRAFCQCFLTLAISLEYSCSVFSSPPEFILILILNNPQSEDKQRHRTLELKGILEILSIRSSVLGFFLLQEAENMSQTHLSRKEIHSLYKLIVWV